MPIDEIRQIHSLVMYTPPLTIQKSAPTLKDFTTLLHFLGRTMNCLCDDGHGQVMHIGVMGKPVASGRLIRHALLHQQQGQT